MNNVKVLENLATETCGKTFTLLSSVDSTNNYIKKYADILADGHLVIAHEQLGGRGRQGKSFYSPFGEGLYMSLLVKNPEKLAKNYKLYQMQLYNKFMDMSSFLRYFTKFRTYCYFFDKY